MTFFIQFSYWTDAGLRVRNGYSRSLVRFMQQHCWRQKMHFNCRGGTPGFFRVHN